jgi:hypothetical protein
MSTITVQQSTPTAERPLYEGAARWAAAGVFVTGAALQAAEFLLAKPTDSNAARVADWVAHPTLAGVSMSLGLVAVPFLLGGFAILLRITRLHSPRLSVVAGASLIAAMVGLAAIHGAEMLAFAAALGGDQAAAIAMLDGEQVVAPVVVLLVMFLGGAVLGTLTLAAAIWRSPMLPRVAALGVVAFAVLDFGVGSPVVSHLVALANAFVIAWAIVSMRSPERSAGAQ